MSTIPNGSRSNFDRTLKDPAVFFFDKKNTAKIKNILYLESQMEFGLHIW